jgi:hypothetical protein
MGKGMNAREQTTAGREYRTSEEAVHKLQEALQGVDNPVAAARALRRVAARFRPGESISWDAFRWAAEKLVKPLLDGMAKPVTWAVLDADFGRLQGDGRHHRVPDGPSPSVRSMVEYLADPNALEPPEPVVSRFAWSKRSTLLSCREKGGKSTLASAVVAAASAGRAFLGTRTPRSRTLYADFEEHPHDLIQRLTDFGADPSNVWIMDRLTTDDPIGELETATDLVKPAVIVVDTLSALTESLGIEPANSSAWTSVMTRLTRIARDSEAALKVLHHSRKTDGRYRDSTAIGAGVDVLLQMSDGREAGERKIEARGRWHIEDFTLRLVGKPGAADYGFELATGELSVDARVILFVERKLGCTTRGIRDGVEARASEIDAAIRRLSAQGVMVNTGTETRHVWEVVQNAENPQGHGTDTVGTHFGTHSAVRGGVSVSPKGHTPAGGAHGTRTPEPDTMADEEGEWPE